MVGLACCLGVFNQAHSQEIDKTQAPLTVIKQWEKGDSLNGDFEASRRGWLASLRKKKGILNPNENEILVEPLDMEATTNEPSRETLEEYISIIKEEARKN